MRGRKFKRNICNHVYQRTIDRFNIFYDTIDYLVYFTIFCVSASKYKVTVLGLCLMIDHIHALVTASCKCVLSNFISNVTSVFVREYNSSLNRKGPLFEKRFGSAPKVDKKRLMSAIIYIWTTIRSRSRYVVRLSYINGTSWLIWCLLIRSLIRYPIKYQRTLRLHLVLSIGVMPQGNILIMPCCRIYGKNSPIRNRGSLLII